MVSTFAGPGDGEGSDISELQPFLREIFGEQAEPHKKETLIRDNISKPVTKIVCLNPLLSSTCIFVLYKSRSKVCKSCQISPNTGIDEDPLNDCVDADFGSPATPKAVCVPADSVDMAPLFDVNYPYSGNTFKIGESVQKQDHPFFQR